DEGRHEVPLLARLAARLDDDRLTAQQHWNAHRLAERPERRDDGTRRDALFLRRLRILRQRRRREPRAERDEAGYPYCDDALQSHGVPPSVDPWCTAVT